MTVEELYQAVSARMDTITDELVRIGKIMQKFENYDEVTVTNGNGKEYTQPRQQFLQGTYDYIKPGGTSDQKLESLRSVFESRICDLSPQKLSFINEKKYDHLWKWATRGAIALLFIVFIVKFFDWETVFQMIK